MKQYGIYKLFINEFCLKENGETLTFESETEAFDLLDMFFAGEDYSSFADVREIPANP